ncbi:unnamed protein product [Acanthoscelides obtectus]|uniref:Uncharacterized protein n=1 Tax=Acanthoscelides obtectus TaxID=200917 RepID=A0A9P0LTS9_ACAOB|nr:unnamed protein product [Acanthoscelides obtectus]CAH2012600.1 unnamed protein product [Acanthoscelides obtectus]CAK1648590.1 hypothetical protein AOBTE_LOCUS15773 [Acanthoscelides obtectus]CAK1648802.1 hypothetical protein AOBTE_LOCUS15884 [Acanthoscelides obtectus]
MPTSPILVFVGLNRSENTPLKKY